MKIQDIPKISLARYHINVPWSRIRNTIKEWETTLHLDLNPPYQRGHVWTDDQQVNYIEFILQGGQSGRSIYFNSPGYFNGTSKKMELVDGKQRLTAILRFLDYEIAPYGYYLNEYEDGLNTIHHSLVVHINDLGDTDVLKWYIHLNSGIAHTDEELEKVKQMIKEN